MASDPWPGGANTGELADLVTDLVRQLREAEGISGDLRTACRCGRWAVTRALAELPLHRAGEGERQGTGARRREVEAERGEARG